MTIKPTKEMLIAEVSGLMLEPFSKPDSPKFKRYRVILSKLARLELVSMVYDLKIKLGLAKPEIQHELWPANPK